MNANSDEGRGSETSARSSSRRGADTGATATARGARTTRAIRRYMVSSTDANMTTAVLTQRLRDLGVTEVVRTLESRGSGLPPVVVVRTSEDSAANLRRTGISNAGALVVERDSALQPANAITRYYLQGSISTAVPSGPGFTATVQVQGESEQPVERTLVQLIGRQWTSEGITGRDGKVALTLFGELPGRAVTLLVKPRGGYWGLYRSNYDLQAEAVNVVTLRPLTLTPDLSWSARAVRFDQLPPDYRGGGTRIALIDTGVATSHRQLAAIKQGLDAAGGDDRTWSHDLAGHGTPSAAILVAAADKENVVRGYAPDAELHVIKLGLDAHCSDLVAALDYCIDKEIDVACVGFGCERGSVIVESRLALAKRKGVATIAAAGSDGGVVQFPASSPQVMAIGAIGRRGTFPDDSLQALQSDSAQGELALAPGSGLFVPPFSCIGPEIDLCAPGVAVISCQSPDGYAVCDGTSVAAPHVAALSALLLAHHPEFRTHLGRRDAVRVERLFQVLKETAQPLGDSLRTGAGLPDAPRALGIAASFFASVQWPPLPASRLSDLRRAMRFAGLGDQEPVVEPARGPVIIGQAQPEFVRSQARATGGTGPEVRMLREAMTVAGLATGV